MTTDPKQPEAQEAPASERDAFERCWKAERPAEAPTFEDWAIWRARAALGKQPTQEAPTFFDKWRDVIENHSMPHVEPHVEVAAQEAPADAKDAASDGKDRT